MLRDSYLLLNAGLESLVCSLKKRADKRKDMWSSFPHTRDMLHTYYSYCDPANYNLILAKGVFPYEYFENCQTLDEDALPPQDEFYSHLNGSGITDEAYAHAQKVWHAFQCQTLRDYANLYVRSDVSLLMDVFASSRNLLYKVYRLDLAHFVSLPSFALNAALKVTDQKLELPKDPIMLNMIDQGMIGGVSMVDTTRFRANTPYLNNTRYNSTLLQKHKSSNKDLAYDASKPKKDILSVDCNALYAWAMSQPLPVSDFAWLSQAEQDTMWKNLGQVVQDYSDNDEWSYFLKVDLSYPSSLHKKHDTFPLAPEHLQIPFDELSSFQQSYLRQQSMTHVTNHKKLIPNLYDKTEYVLHIKNLQQYLALGLVCTKLHKVIRFKQKAWLKPYIYLNTRLRQEGAGDPFAVAFWQLMNNILYDKTIEDASKYRTLKLVNNYQDYVRLVVKLEFVHAKLVADNSAIMELKTEQPYSNKPRYLGVAVLAYAKHHLYEFHYNHVLKHFEPDEVRLLMTDTDSLCYGFTTDKDVPCIFKTKMRDVMDYSNYPETHPWHDKTHKLVPGKWKEEWGGCMLREFIGLKPKMYSQLVGHYSSRPAVESDTQQRKQAGKQTAKGIPFRYKEQNISHQDYADTIRHHSKIQKRVTFHSLQSKNMEINQVQETRTGLNYFNDKKFVESVTRVNHSFGYNP